MQSVLVILLRIRPFAVITLSFNCGRSAWTQDALMYTWGTCCKRCFPWESIMQMRCKYVWAVCNQTQSPHHQRSHSDQQAQQQAHHKQPHAADQHGHQATQSPDAQADAHGRLDAQLRVHHSLLVAQHEDDHRAEHEAGEEQHGLEASIAWSMEIERERTDHHEDIKDFFLRQAVTDVPSPQTQSQSLFHPVDLFTCCLDNSKRLCHFSTWVVTR